MTRYTIHERSDPPRVWSVFSLVVIFGGLSLISERVAVAVGLVWLALWVWWRLLLWTAQRVKEE